MAPAFQVTYLQEFDPGVQERVRRRFAKDIGFLMSKDFHELCFYGEQLPPLSLRRARYLPINVLMFFAREVLSMRNGRQITASFILMLNPEMPTLALPMGMGIKLYTAFEDGHLLITNSFPVLESPRPGTNVDKQSSAGKGMDVWAFHLKRIAEYEGRGQRPDPLLDFNRYILLSNQEEDAIIG